MKFIFAVVKERFLKVTVETSLLLEETLVVLKETKWIMSQVFSQHLQMVLPSSHHYVLPAHKITVAK